MEIDKIYNEDCLQGMKKIPDGSVDAVICDLPYGTTACKWDVIIPYKDIVEQARLYIHTIGGFEKFAECGLVRPLAQV